MNPARRATVGFIWSVRLSEAKPSRNSRDTGSQQPVEGRREGVVTVGGFVGK